MTSAAILPNGTTLLQKASLAGAAALKGPKRGQPAPAQPASREAQRLAAVILEVLAGVRTPPEAAAALTVSLPQYYLWERRALAGLVLACERRRVGKGRHPQQLIATLEKEIARLRQDCARQQALVRAAQRTIGLGPPPPPKPVPKILGKASANGVAKARRKRRPVARALIAAAALQAASAAEESTAGSSSATVREVLQRSAEDSLPPRTGAAQTAPAASGP